MSHMRIGVVGAGGKMGKATLDAILAHQECELVGAVVHPNDPRIGTDAGLLIGTAPIGVALSADAPALFAQADAVIDFTAPEATIRFSALAAQGKTAHIIGTTGLDARQKEALRRAAAHTPIFYAPNMSFGVALLAALVAQTTQALGNAFDIEILEMHHRDKRDAPSGTALMLGEAAARSRGVTLDDVAAIDRNGKRAPGAIGFASLRGGDAIGEHTVLFAAPGERITLRHVASDRTLFAKGALRAAFWLQDKPPGFYGMQDMVEGTPASQS